MNKNKSTSKVLKNTEIDTKHKLSALWLVFMMLYIYTDFYTLYMPETIQDMMSGLIMDGTMEVTQLSLLVISIITIIPAFMIFLSLVLSAKVNRWLNIIFGILHIVIGVVNLSDATWAYYIFYGISLVVIAILIVVYAWRWPQNDDVS